MNYGLLSGWERCLFTHVSLTLSTGLSMYPTEKHLRVSNCLPGYKLTHRRFICSGRKHINKVRICPRHVCMILLHLCAVRTYYGIVSSIVFTSRLTDPASG